MAPKTKIVKRLEALGMPHDEQYREMLAKDKGLRQIHNKVTEWQEKMAEGGYRLSEGLMIGGRSLGEIMDQLGVKPEEMNHEGQRRIAALYLDSLNKTHNKDGQLCPPVSAVVYEKKTGETKLEQPGWGDGFVASMQPVHLTKWDKFCRFFGVTTSRIRYNKMVEESQRLAEAKKNNIETTRVKVDGAKRREFLTNRENKAAFDKNQELLDDITKNRERWNEFIFFGNAKPEDFHISGGKSIPAFTVAVSRMMQKDPAKLQQLMSMKPKEAAMNNEMLKFVREVTDECYELRGKGEKEVLDFVTPKEGTAPNVVKTVQDGLTNPSMSQIADMYPFTAAKRELDRVTEGKYPVYSNLQPEEKLLHLAVQKAYHVNTMCKEMKECNYGRVKNAVELISGEKVGDSKTMLIENAGKLLQTDPRTLAREQIQREQILVELADRWDEMEDQKLEGQPDLDFEEPDLDLEESDLELEEPEM